MRLTIGIAIVGRMPRSSLRREAAAEVLAAAVQFEQQQGFASPTTRYLVGGALLAQQAYVDARTALEQALALAPDSASVLANLAIADLHLGDFERAVAHLERAIELRPHMVNAYTTMVDVHRHRILDGQRDAKSRAVELVERAPLPEIAKARFLLGIYADSALAKVRRRDPTAPDDARAALEAGARCEQLAGLSQGQSTQIAVARQIAAGEIAFDDVMKVLLNDPLNWGLLALTRSLVPDTVPAASSELIRQYFDALVSQEAPIEIDGEPRDENK